MYYTPKMLEIITRCETKPGIVKDAVKNLLLNTYPIYKVYLLLMYVYEIISAILERSCSY